MPKGYHSFKKHLETQSHNYLSLYTFFNSKTIALTATKHTNASTCVHKFKLNQTNRDQISQPLHKF